MTAYRLPNEVGEPDLEFEGELLARSTSWREGKTFWTELELYRTEGGNYALGVLGAVAPGCGEERPSAFSFTSAQELVRHFHGSEHYNYGGRLAVVAVALLRDAAEKDDDLWDAVGGSETTTVP